jgi:predicted DNA-binding transcriptional regulator AlpA
MAHPIKDVRASADELKPLTVTVAVARKISGLGNTTVYALIKARKLETVHVGRRTLITLARLKLCLRRLLRLQNPPRRKNNERGHAKRHRALLLPEQAAKILNVSCSWLAKARMTGEGPEFIKIGRAVRYSPSSLKKFMKVQTRISAG